MAEKRANNPFYFQSRLVLNELTGLKASTIPELLDHIKGVPGSVIYRHTHHFLEQHQRVVPTVPNDFAYWVIEELGEKRLGEKLAAINTIDFNSIRELRDKIAQVIEDYLRAYPQAASRTPPPGLEFHFMKSQSFIFQTQHAAYTLEEFCDCLMKVTLTSVYYHVFESRLRFERPANDFSRWLADELGEKELAGAVARLNPYDHSLEGLREKIITLVHKRSLQLIGRPQ